MVISCPVMTDTVRGCGDERAGKDFVPWPISLFSSVIASHRRTSARNAQSRSLEEWHCNAGYRDTEGMGRSLRVLAHHERDEFVPIRASLRNNVGRSHVQPFCTSRLILAQN
jgi:hypothetical protein